MDRYGGSFDAHDDAFGDAGPFGFDAVEADDGNAPLAPFSPVGQDERRMQVRAYNHWAGLLGAADFPDIADLHPESLGDFGPNGILLEFSGKRGVDDPTIRFLGAKLAVECGTDTRLKRLSDVPGRSLLSRITDHYLQILANRAPIGFEAEFTNQAGAQVLYRGILLPWSSNGETIDFVFGVINWKELADAEVAERLLSAINDALAVPIPPYEEQDMDRMLDLPGFASEASADDEAAGSYRDLPSPTFGSLGQSADAGVEPPLDLVDELDDESDEDSREATEWGAGFSGFGDEDTTYSVDYGAQGLEDGAEDEDSGDVVDPLADSDASFGLASLVSRSGRVKQSVVLPGMGRDDGRGEPAGPSTLEERIRAALADGDDFRRDEDEPFELDLAFQEPVDPAGPSRFDIERDDSATGASHPLADAVVSTPRAPTLIAEPTYAAAEAEPEGLYDCLAAARELAQTARSSEDRGRKALYQAVARAYDFSLEAAANPADFDELLAENGLTVQDRAPMTPIVKLVFGADYDKTRLTEYATVLGFAHRTGVARGDLDSVLARAEGGLKGVVQAERHARREAEGKPVAPRDAIKVALARKLRRLDPMRLEDLAGEGGEFALVMIRRLPSGELVVLGEVPDDVPLIEKAARKLVS